LGHGTEQSCFQPAWTLKDGSASQELAGDVKSSLYKSSAAGNVHLTFGSISRNTFKCPAKVDLYIVNLYAVSVGTPMIMFIFLFISRFIVVFFSTVM